MKNEFANTLIDFAIRKKPENETKSSWVMTKEAAMIITEGRCDITVIRRAWSLISEDFLLTGEDVYKFCHGWMDPQTNRQKNTNDIVGFFLNRSPTGYTLDIDSRILNAALNCLDGVNITRLLDLARGPVWKNPSWDHRMIHEIIYNNCYAPKVLGVVLDRFDSIEINLDFFHRTLSGGYASTHNDHDRTAMQVLQRQRDKIVEDQYLRETGISNGGILVVTNILKKETTDKGEEYDIREMDLESIVKNETCGLQMLTTLLDGIPNLNVSDSVFETAARCNRVQALDIVRLLLQRCPHLEVTQDVVIDAFQNSKQSVELLPFLFKYRPDSIKFFTAEILKRERSIWYSNKDILPGLRILLNHPNFDRTTIDTDILVVAAKNCWNDDEYKHEHDENALSILLDAVHLTEPNEIEEVAYVALANNSPLKMMQILCSRIPNGQLPVTSRIVEAAAKSRYKRCKILKDLIDRNPTVQITEEAINNACSGIPDEERKYKPNGKEELELATDAIKFLLERFPDGPKPTSAALENAAGSSFNADKMLTFLFETFPDLEVTEGAFKAAARRPYSNGLQTIAQLLDHAPLTPLTSDFLKVCFQNGECRKEIFNWLYPRLNTLNIDEKIKKQITPELIASM